MARKEDNRIYLTESEFNNIITEAVSLLLEGRPAKWNYEECYNEAKKYTNRDEFKRNAPGAYGAARKNGWLNDYTWFERKVKPYGYWNYETCYQEAKKHTSKHEFERNAKGAYEAARKNGWLKDYTWFEKFKPTTKNVYIVYCYKDEGTNTVYVGLTNDLRIRDLQHRRGKIKHGERIYDVLYKYYEIIGQPIPQPIILKENLYANEAQDFERYYVEYFKKEGWNVLNIAKAGSLGALYKWTEAKCYDEAKKYTSRAEFRRNAGGAYNAARKNDWLKDYTWFKRPSSHKKKWDYDSCYQEAKKYTSRIEFNRNAKGAYNVARKNGWLKDYVWFEKKWGKWNYETCYQEAKKYTSRREFERNAGGAYNVARNNGWLDDYTWFERPKKWNYETCYQEAKKYNSRLEFCRNNPTAYNIARENNWLNDYAWFEKIMGKWDYNACYNEAKKYTSRIEFNRNARGAYNVARKNGWLDDYTWFAPSSTAKKWDYDACYNEAKKYKGRNEFKLNASRAYKVALKNGWLDDYTWFNKPATKKTKNISLNELKSVIKNEVSNLLKELRHKDL